MKPFRLRRPGNRQAAAVVEAAIALPILLIVILGTVEVCNTIFMRQSMLLMAFEGARVAAIPDATLTDVEQQVQLIATQRDVVIKSVEVSPADFASQPAGTFLEVTVTSDAAQPGRTRLFSTTEKAVSVFIMKEHD